MFTIKFIRNGSGQGSGEYCISVSTPRYDLDLRDKSAFVITYHNRETGEFAGSSGTEFHIMNRNAEMEADSYKHMISRGFDVAFVTNESGKTVDRIGPFN